MAVTFKGTFFLLFSYKQKKKGALSYNNEQKITCAFVCFFFLLMYTFYCIFFHALRKKNKSQTVFFSITL